MAERSAGRRRTARRVTRARLGRDASLLIAGQAVRAAGYGFTAVLLEALLAVVALTGTLSTDVVDRYRRHGRPRHPVEAPRRAGAVDRPPASLSAAPARVVAHAPAATRRRP
ncbi:MAG TPA: hypothetical protein VGO74_11225 [Modestobacter sp.]|nr:hypothetical protein [Modestobacter sp.]